MVQTKNNYILWTMWMHAEENQSFAKNFHYIPLFLYIKLSKCEKAATKWADRCAAWLRGKVLASQHEELVVSFQNNDQWVGRSVQRNRKDDSSQTRRPSASISRSLIVETTGKCPTGIPGDGWRQTLVPGILLSLCLSWKHRGPNQWYTTFNDHNKNVEGFQCLAGGECLWWSCPASRLRWRSHQAAEHEPL